MGLDHELIKEYQHSLASCCDQPTKLMKVMAQILGQVEVASKEAPNAFMDRENENPTMLQYPKSTDVSYMAIVREKWERVMQEVRRLDIEGDRRRFSMLVQGVLDPDWYMGALADFLYTICSTMIQDTRRGEGNNGLVIKFEEGILCQWKNPYPGTVCKLSSGRDGGWFAALLAVTRRLVLKDTEFSKDTGTTMNKCMINFKAVDKKKAEVLLKALNEFEATQLSHNFRERRLVRSGQLVHDYLRDCAAMSKRIFTRLNRDRFNKATEKFSNPIEKDDCFTKLRTLEEKTVLRFCQNCRGKI